MKKAIKLWATGAQWLFTDNLISFYFLHFISSIILALPFFIVNTFIEYSTLISYKLIGALHDV